MRTTATLLWLGLVLGLVAWSQHPGLFVLLLPLAVGQI
jgi:hypothetical protein